jgi:hypothetical protein
LRCGEGLPNLSPIGDMVTTPEVEP